MRPAGLVEGLDPPKLTTQRVFAFGTSFAHQRSVMELDDILILRAFSAKRRALSERLRSGPPAPAEVALAFDALSPPERQRVRAQARAMRLMRAQWVAPWELPGRLADVLAPACGLFLRGERTALEREGIAIVGARRASRPAQRWAAQVAAAAVEAGLQVISGGARGIDASAHRAACDARGQTLAFIGVGVDRLYPAGNRALFGRILEQGGAVVSEHPPGEGGRPFDHAERNRFIAAAGQALFVAEAGERSGTLRTARIALRLRRPVWLSPPGVARLRGGLIQLMDEGAQEMASNLEASSLAFTVAGSGSLSVLGGSPRRRGPRRRIEP